LTGLRITTATESRFQRRIGYARYIEYARYIDYAKY